MILSRIFIQFFNSEKAGGIILFFVTLASLLLANSAWQENYINFWHQTIGSKSITHWINDGLMAIFFLLIGLELEREIYLGELSDIKNATLPLFGAIGGILLPAGIFLLFNYGTSAQAGSGIPTATDIAFAVGVLSMLGKRVPDSLKVFLVALAIIDDLGAILIIALFYTTSIAFLPLFIALGIFAVLLLLKRFKVRILSLYLVAGVAMWYFILNSGVHATVAGVMLAFAIPFVKGSKKSPSYRLQDFLHKPVAFLILPLFALANTAIAIKSDWYISLTETSSLGILVGLVIGKPLGIWLFTLLGVGLGLCALPSDLRWKNIIGAGFFAGIGFTMSIFITLLAYNDAAMINTAKIAIIVASVVAGTIGFLWLRLSLKAPNKKPSSNSRLA